jgi:predicted Zn-dependent peptidase
MFKVFNDMRSTDVTPQELADAKSRMSGGLVMQMQTIAQQANLRVEGILNGYPIDYYDLYPQHLDKVNADQVRQVMEEYVKDNAMDIVVVAPAAVKPQLQELGDVQVIPMPLNRQPATNQSSGGS